MANAILLAMTDWSPQEWDARFRALAPERDIRLWPDRIGDRAEVAHYARPYWWRSVRNGGYDVGCGDARYDAKERDKDECSQQGGLHGDGNK